MSHLEAPKNLETGGTATEPSIDIIRFASNDAIYKNRTVDPSKISEPFDRNKRIMILVLSVNLLINLYSFFV
mgnify:CR=1 FL=1